MGSAFLWLNTVFGSDSALMVQCDFKLNMPVATTQLLEEGGDAWVA